MGRGQRSWGDAELEEPTGCLETLKDSREQSGGGEGINDGRHVEGRGRGWGAGPRWLGRMGFGCLLVTPATHTHTHTHTQSPHKARMLLQPHASPQVERTPGSASPGSALSAPGTGRYEAAGVQKGRAEAAQPTQGGSCGTSESVPPPELG